MYSEKKRDRIVAALEKLGYGDAVMVDWNRDGDLALNCEVWCGDDVGMVGDYYAYSDGGDSLYDDFGVKVKVAKLLDKLKAYAEWYNPAVLIVCDA